MNSDFGALYAVLMELREKCPWDKAQTMESLRLHTLEEVHELCASLLAQDPENLREELGDVLVHLLLYTIIAQEKKWFGVEELLQKTKEKMIFRHPHIYQDTVADSQESVKKNWEIQKTKEKKAGRGVLEGVPQSLPALIRAYRIQQKLANIGLDLPDIAACYTHISEEIEEIKTAPNHKAQEEEIGDLLFSVVNLARKLDIDPDLALERSCQKFTQRVDGMEKIAAQKQEMLAALPAETLEKYYQIAKKNKEL